MAIREAVLGDSRFLISRGFFDFSDALPECQQLLGSKASLVSFSNQEEFDLVTSLIETLEEEFSFSVGGVWTGLSLEDTDPRQTRNYKFESEDENPFVHVNRGQFPWAGNQPAIVDAEDTCVQISGIQSVFEPRRLVTVSCSVQLNLACRVPTDEFVVAKSTIGDLEILLPPQDISATSGEANLRCKSLFNDNRATLASMPRSGDNVILANLIQTTSWVGLRLPRQLRSVRPINFLFEDGSTNEDIESGRNPPWKDGQPNGSGERCVELDQDGLVSSTSCNNPLPFICSLDTRDRVTRTVFNSKSDFLATNDQNSFFFASNRCRTLMKNTQATLVSFTSESDFDKLITVTKRVQNADSSATRFWTGLSLLDVESGDPLNATQFIFTDNTKNTFANVSGAFPWADTEPNGQENCVALDVETEALVSTDCRESLPILCVAPINERLKKNFKRSEYLVTPPSLQLDFFSAELKCKELMEDEGAALASINSPDELDFVVSLIDRLENQVNPPLGYWFGLFMPFNIDVDRANLSKHFFFTDGTINSFAVNNGTFPWQANQPVIVEPRRCVSLDRRQNLERRRAIERLNLFVTQSCFFPMPFVCKLDRSELPHVVNLNRSLLATKGSVRLPYRQAKKECKILFKDKRATLSSFSSVTEVKAAASFLKEAQLSQFADTNEFWVGLYASNQLGADPSTNLFFLDGSSTDFIREGAVNDFWKEGAPTNAARCAVFNLESELFRAVPCGGAIVHSYPFLCSLKKDRITDTFQRESPDKTFLLSSSTLRLSVEDANEECKTLMESEDATLASVSSEAELRVIQSLLGGAGNLPADFFWTGVSKSLNDSNSLVSIDEALLFDTIDIGGRLSLDNSLFDSGEQEICIGTSLNTSGDLVFSDNRCSLEVPFVCSLALVQVESGSAILDLFANNVSLTSIPFFLLVALLGVYHQVEVSKLSRVSTRRRRLLHMQEFGNESEEEFMMINML